MRNSEPVIGEGRSRAAADRLREVAGPDLYRRNPFRVTGLATDVRSPEVRQRRQLALGAMDLGVGAQAGDRRLPLPRPPSAHEVRAAFDAVERPDRRMVDELFWWWGAPGSCGCAVEVHELHDTAVEAHARALDLELGEPSSAERLAMWADVADAWMDALDHGGFWGHVRHRVAALSDRRLDESTVEGLREALPSVLLVPQTVLARDNEAAAELAELLDEWDVDDEIIDEARLSAAAPTCERIDAKVKEVDTLLDAGGAHTAAQRAQELLPLAALLETLAPHDQYRRSAKQRNKIAVMLNNCALALGERHRTLAATLLNHAAELVVDPDDRDAVQNNLARLHLPWDRLNSLLRAGKLEEAEKLLQSMRAAADETVRPEIDSALQALHRSGVRPLRPHAWLANLALCFGFTEVVWFLMVEWWQTPVGLAGLVLVLLAPVPITVAYSRAYRDRTDRLILPLVGVIALVCLVLVGTAFPQGLWPVLLFFFVFAVATPVTIPIGRSWAQRREQR